MKTHPRRTGQAFSLIEVTLALGVAGFCLIAIFGLLPVALKSNQAAIQQTAANGILSAVVADLRATAASASGATSSQYSIALPASGDTGSTTLYFTSEQQVAASASLGRYRVTIDFLTPPSGSGMRTATMTNVKVTWPARVDPTVGTPAGSAETFVALDRN